MGPGIDFRMELHREERQFMMVDALVTAIIGIDKPGLETCLAACQRRSYGSAW